jgi:hypothetical protein
MVRPPKGAESTTPIRTTAAPGSGSIISPPIVAMKMPVSRHPSGFTAAGFGIP